MTTTETSTLPPTDDIQALPFETQELRAQLEAYLNCEWPDPLSGEPHRIGDYKWGVYAFYDYDNEPIYVGQTNEKLRTRIRRHLTNQRTDAVAMNVLDPFEVCSIEVFPLPEFEGVSGGDRAARRRLDALEYQVYFKLLRESQFQAVLNEKEPPAPETPGTIPPSYKARIVSNRVSELRDHPDLRIARRAATLARLAQVICERKVQTGLRKVLMVQAKRLLWLAERRYSRAAGDSGQDSEPD